MSKLSRRKAIKMFAGAGMALAALPIMAKVAAAAPQVSSPIGSESVSAVRILPSSMMKSPESLVLHLKNGRLVGYRGTTELVFSDDELVARISQKFAE